MTKAHLSAMIRDGGLCSQISANKNPDFFQVCCLISFDLLEVSFNVVYLGYFIVESSSYWLHPLYLFRYFKSNLRSDNK